MAPQLGSTPCRRGSAVRNRAHPPSLERAAALLGAVALTGVAACAAMEKYKTTPGVLAGNTFTPALPPALQYGPNPTLPPCAPTSVQRSVVRFVDDTAKKEQRQPSTADPRLCAVADTLSGWDVERNGEPPATVVAFLMHYFGLPERTARPLLTTFETDDAKVIATRLTNTITNASFSMTKPIWGLVTTHPKRKQTSVVLVLADDAVLLDPLPRRLDLGGRATVSGKLAGGDYDTAAVIVNDVSGRIKLTRSPAAQPFQGEVVCGDEPGRVLVQIRGEKEGAGTPLADFPVVCGDALPTSVELPPPPPATVDVPAAEKRLFEDINRTRQAAGLAPLAWDDGVAQVARALSDAMRDQAQGKGGAMPDLVAALKANDIVSPLVLQNPARERSVYLANQAFENSPVHRSNMLNPDVTNAGVGVAVMPATKDQPASVFVNELFVKELQPLDLAAVEEKLRAAIAQKREDARAGALKDDPALDQIAQRYADALAANRGEVPKEQIDEISAELTKKYRPINVVLGATADPLDFAEQPKIISPGKQLGIGVAQGVHPVLGKNAPYVVIAIGTAKRGRR